MNNGEGNEIGGAHGGRCTAEVAGRWAEHGKQGERERETQSGSKSTERPEDMIENRREKARRDEVSRLLGSGRRYKVIVRVWKFVKCGCECHRVG